MNPAQELADILEDIATGRETSIESARTRLLQWRERNRSVEHSAIWRTATEPDAFLSDLPWREGPWDFDTPTPIPGCCE